MSKSIREQERAAAQQSRPASIKTKKKRVAPGARKPNAIRRDPARQDEKYGKTVGIRMPTALREGIKSLAQIHQVDNGEMSRYLLALSVKGIAEHGVEVPVHWDSEKQKNVIDLPQIPTLK